MPRLTVIMGSVREGRIPFFTQLMKNGVFKGNETTDKAVPVMLGELLRWTEALRLLRV